MWPLAASVVKALDSAQMCISGAQIFDRRMSPQGGDTVLAGACRKFRLGLPRAGQDKNTFWPFHCFLLHEGGVLRRSFFGNFQYQTASTACDHIALARGCSLCRHSWPSRHSSARKPSKPGSPTRVVGIVACEGLLGVSFPCYAF